MGAELVFSIELERDGFRFVYNGYAAAELLGIAGPSGSGKTTLLRLLCGLEQPSCGRVSLNGRVLYDSATGVSVPPEQRRIGLVFQDSRLFPHLTVERNIRFGMTGHRRAGGPGPGLRALSDLLELRPLLHRRPSSLSGGEQQRVALARALMAGPDCLLLDEPFSALDAKRRSSFVSLIADLRRVLDIPILMVSHNDSDHIRAADRVIRIDDGILLSSIRRAPSRRAM